MIKKNYAGCLNYVLRLVCSWGKIHSLNFRYPREQRSYVSSNIKKLVLGGLVAGVVWSMTAPQAEAFHHRRWGCSAARGVRTAAQAGIIPAVAAGVPAAAARVVRGVARADRAAAGILAAAAGVPAVAAPVAAGAVAPAVARVAIAFSRFPPPAAPVAPAPAPGAPANRPR